MLGSPLLTEARGRLSFPTGHRKSLGWDWLAPKWPDSGPEPSVRCLACAVLSTQCARHSVAPAGKVLVQTPLTARRLGAGRQVEMLGGGRTGRGRDQGVWGQGAASCFPSPMVRLAPGFQAPSTEEPKAVGLVEFWGDLLQFVLIGDAL